MFSTIRWCQYTSAAALLGLACSSSSSTPSETADDASDDGSSLSASSTSPAGSAATGSSGEQNEVSGSPGQGPAAASPGTGPYAVGEPRLRGDEGGPGAAARSEGTGASGDISASERAPVSGRDEATALLDDPRIVAITNTANKAEVEQGRLARERAKDPRVRDFAAMMVDHHSQALRDEQKLKVEPEPGADVLNMQREGKQRMSDLRQKKGAEFDRAYIELQIEEHRRLLDKLNRELMPAAKDEAVVSYLEEIRPRVESHLAQAERLQRELSTTSQSDTSKRDDTRTKISNERGSDVRVSEPK